MKRLLSALLVFTMLAASLVVFTACGPKKEDVPSGTKWELYDIQNIERDGEPIDSVLVGTTYEVLKRLYGEYTYKKDSKGYITETQFWIDRIEFKDGKVYYHEVVGTGDSEEYSSATVYSSTDWTVTECGTYEGAEITVTLSECKDIYFTEGQLIMKAEFKSSGGILTADLVFTKVGAML